MSAKTAVDKALSGGGKQTGEGDFQPDFFSASAPPVEPEGKRAPGRPKGAVNKTTADMIAYIQRQYGDPRVALARVMATPFDVLKRELGVDRETTADFWKACVLGLLPYIAGKPAVEVAVKSESTKLVLFAGTPQAPVELGSGGVVGLLEQAARQAKEEGWDSPLPVTIEGEAEEVPASTETKA